MRHCRRPWHLFYADFGDRRRCCGVFIALLSRATPLWHRSSNGVVVPMLVPPLTSFGIMCPLSSYS